MDAAFSSIAFAEPARAEANLAQLESRLSGMLWSALPALLAQLPDPDAALNFLERFLHSAPDGVRRFISRNPNSLHHLLVVFSHSRFLSETLIAQSDLLQWVERRGPHGSLERIKTQEDLHEEFARFESVASELPPSVLLARFKRREYLRIMLRDVLGLATLAETTMELSDLADVLLERALRLCEQTLQNSFGGPQFTDAEGHRHPVRISVLSLGKLGARELNYNSDVDLMFLFARDGDTTGGARGSITNAEYFVRLAQALLKVITEATQEGAVFRVDLRLRPQGQEGDLAVSLPAALDYYRHRAREWELQMLIKTRCSAGSSEVARTFLSELHPLVFPPTGVLEPAAIAAIESVLNARQEISKELRRRAGAESHPVEWNVKLSPGGIRDIEFLVQCLQRVYGGTDPWLASPAAAGTLVALQRLHDKGYLSGRDFFRLGTAYQFLRRIEHRLQLRDGLQRHTLPEDPGALDRLARRCAIEPAPGKSSREQLLHRLRQHFSEVREIYERVLKPGEADRTLPSAVQPDLEPGEGALMQRLRRDFPQAAQATADCLSAGSESSPRGLHRFLSSAILDPECMALLESRPELISRAVHVLSRSDLLTEMLARHPCEIALLDKELNSAAEATHSSALIGNSHAEIHSAESSLRVAIRRRTFSVVVRAVEITTPPFETFAALTRIAEDAVRGALALAASACGIATSSLEGSPFAVLALGRLGTQEIDIASDADLVFIADESLTADSREPWRRVAEQFVHIAGSHTREGLLLPVDTRLRPRGAESDLVQSEAYLREYCAAEAQAWEALAWLKARPIAGNLELGTRAIRAAQEIFVSRFGGVSGFINELRAMRGKIEKDAEGIRAKGEFKKITGGYYDVEYILGYHFISQNVQPLAAHVLRQIATLETAGALDTASAITLRSGAFLYRALDHAVRLVTGRAANRLPEPALAERIVTFLEDWRVPLAADASKDAATRLSATVSATRAQLRALFDRFLSNP